MIPRKANSLIPEVAREMNLSEDLVEDIISFYWKEVRKILSSLGEKRIKLMSFGTFEARKNVLESMLIRYREMSQNLKVTNYRKHHIQAQNLEKLERIKVLLDDFQKEEQKKKSVKEKRNAGTI